MKKSRLLLILYYVFFPVTFPGFVLWEKYLTYLMMKAIDRAVAEKQENKYLKIAAAFILYTAKKNDHLPKKYFAFVMKRLYLKLYNRIYSTVSERARVDFSYFKQLMGVYMTYDMLGSATLNENKETVIEVN